MHRQPFTAMQLDVFVIRVFIFFNTRVAFKEKWEIGRRWLGVVVGVTVTPHDDPLFTVERL